MSDGKQYGQKGGDGPNTGKKATRYKVELPNGTTQYKRSYNCHEPEAVAGCFRLTGKSELCVGGIWPSEAAFIEMHGDQHGYTFVKAVAV